MTVSYLFRNRERPRLMSSRFFKVWVKRLLTAPALASTLGRNLRLRLRGAAIADLCVIEPVHLEGDRSKLRIGSGSFIGRDSSLFLHEQITIGERVVINRDVTILTASHDVADPTWTQHASAVVIEDYAWIAMRAMILPGVRVGRGAVVGAGAVVHSDVPDQAIVVGNPQTLLRKTRDGRLAFLPTARTAVFEAWLGPPSCSESKHEPTSRAADGHSDSAPI